MTATVEALPLDLAGLAGVEREQLVTSWAQTPPPRPAAQILAPSRRAVRARDSKRAVRRRLARIQDHELRDRALARLELSQYLPRVNGQYSGFVTCQGQWLKKLNSTIDATDLRIDAKDNLRAVAWQVAVRAGWIDHTARIDWDTAATAAGLKRRTLAKWLRWLRKHGWLGHVERGTTARWRTQLENALYGDQNRQPIYLLCAPAGAPVRTQEALVDQMPADSPEEAQAGGDQLSTGTKYTPTLSQRSSSKKPPRTREGKLAWCPQTKLERLEAAEQIQNRCGLSWHTVKSGHQEREVLVRPPLRSLSARYLAHLVRDFWAAGWTVDDVLHGIDHRPDGIQRTATGPVQVPAAWLAARLNHWRDASGQPIHSKRQHKAAVAAATAAHQEAKWATWHAAAPFRSELPSSPIRETWQAIRHAMKLKKHGAS